MTLDPATLFTTVTIADFAGAFVICGLLVTLKALPVRTRLAGMIWVGAIFLSGLSCLLLGLRGQIPDSISILTANAILLIGHGLRPNAIRYFFGKSLKFMVLPILGVGGWLILMMIPAFQETLIFRSLYVHGYLLIEVSMSAWFALSLNRMKLVTARLICLPLALEAIGHVLYLSTVIEGQHQDFMASFGSSIMAVYLALILSSMVLTTILVPAAAIEELQQSSRQKAWRDDLTGLLNRRAFEREARSILARQADCKQPHALILLDIDNLNQHNITFGSDMGDALLKLVGRISRDSVPDSVLIGRLGEDDIALLMPEATQTQAEDAAARILAATKIQAAEASGGRIDLSISAGIYWGWAPLPVAEIVEIASSCLLRAKKKITNRIFINTNLGKSNSAPGSLSKLFSTRRRQAA